MENFPLTGIQQLALSILKRCASSHSGLLSITGSHSAGLLFLGSKGGNSQLLHLSIEARCPGYRGYRQCYMLDGALVDSPAAIHDVFMHEDLPGRLLAHNSILEVPSFGIWTCDSIPSPWTLNSCMGLKAQGPLIVNSCQLDVNQSINELNIIGY